MCQVFFGRVMVLFLGFIVIDIYIIYHIYNIYMMNLTPV